MKTNKYIYIIFIIIILITSFIVYKIFNKEMVIIAFDTDNGNIIKEIEIPKNSKISSLPRAKKDGYIFLYWTLDNKEFNKEMIIKDNIILKAKYQEIDNNVIVSFDTLEGDNISSLVIEKNTKIDKLPIAHKDGYIFLGWLYLNKEFNKEMIIKDNIVLVAKYKRIND